MNRWVMRLAGPAILTMISQTVVMVTDTAMVGRLGATSIAAAGLGGISMFTCISIFFGVSIAVQILSARRFGQGNFSGAGEVLVSTLLPTILFGGAVTLVGWAAAQPVVNLLVDDAEVRQLCAPFLQYRLAGYMFVILGLAYRGFYDGLGFTYISLIAASATMGVNVFLNWLLIYGNLGAPELGLNGAGIASSIAAIPSLLIPVAFHAKKAVRKCFKGARLLPSWAVLRQLGSTAFPISLENILLHISFLGLFKIAGLISSVSMAATNVIVSIFSLSFMPGYAFGVAATTVLGQAMGARKPRLAYLGTHKAAAYSALVMGALGVGFYVAAYPLAAAFTDDAAVIREVIPSLTLVAFIQVGDAYHMVMGSALRSAGMVYWVMASYTAASWLLMLPLAYFLGVTFKLGTLGIWAGVSVWLVVLGLVFLRKFDQRQWVDHRF